MNLLLIDETIPMLEKFKNGINQNTKIVTYSISDSFENLNKKIEEFELNEIENIGFVFIDDNTPLKMFVSYNTYISFDYTGINENNTTNFIKEIIKKYSVKKLDFLACNLLSYPLWKSYFDYLMKENEGLIVRASNDRTGNLNAGGDWILESTNEDVSKLYFNENIQNWNYLLDGNSLFYTVLQSIDSNLISSGLNSYGEQNSLSALNVKTIKNIRNISNVKKVICGGAHTMIIKDDNTLWGCGLNEYGQLGDGTFINKNEFTKCSNDINGNEIKDLLFVACGDAHTIIIRNDGTVWSCGRNNYGQLGINSTENKSIFTKCSNDSNGDEITNAIFIACGLSYTMIIRQNGINKTLWGCGLNNDRQLGNNSTENKLIFTKCSNDSNGNEITNVTQISCGQSHTMIIRSDGTNKTIWACGNNGFNKLGVSDNFNKSVFTKCANDNTDNEITDAYKISCGQMHTMVIRDNGIKKTVWGCGLTNMGSLGISGGFIISRFTKCSNDNNGNEITNAIDLYCGTSSSIIVREDGSNKTLWGTGYNYYNELGNGTNNPIFVFTKYIDPENDEMNDIIGVGFRTMLYVMVLRGTITNTTLWGCGDNTNSQMGTDFKFKKFQHITEFDKHDILCVSSGINNTMIIKNNGTIWGCGRNNYGQLGIGTAINKAYFTKCANDSEGNEINNAITISCGKEFTMIIRNDGTVWGCGLNNNGQLGNGTATDKTIFTKCTTDSEGNAITNAKIISCGQLHSMIIRDDDTVWGCGLNNYGQLGDNTTTNRDIFTKCANDSLGNEIMNILYVACGGEHTMIIKNDGTVWGCGLNEKGQLGDNSYISKSVFTKCSNDNNGNEINNATAISCGELHTIIIRNDGINSTIWGCGSGISGQISGWNDKISKFIQCINDNEGNQITNAKSILCGPFNTILIRDDGTVWSTGYNNNGQLGDNTYIQKNIFTKSSFIENNKVKYSNITIKNILFNSSLVNFNTTNKYAYLPNMTDKILTTNDITELNSDIKNILTTTDKKIIHLLPANTIFNDYISFTYNLPKNIMDLKVYFQSESDLAPYLLTENIDSGYGAYYEHNENTGLLTIYTKHFSIVGIGYNNLDCLLDDTLILTPMGYIKINKLKIGDNIITSNLKIKKIKNIKKYEFNNNPRINPYIIPKDYFGKNIPSKDTRLSKGHNILVNNKWITPAKNYHVFKQDNKLEKFTYYHIELDDYLTDNLVINGGLIVESYGEHSDKNLSEARKRIKESIILKNKKLFR